MSRLNGPGAFTLRRSKATRPGVALALISNCSRRVAPFTSMVSMPSPPSLMSSSSPPFQTSVSSPASPRGCHGCSGGCRRQYCSRCRCRRRSSGPSLPSSVSLPSPPSISTANARASSHWRRSRCRRRRPRVQVEPLGVVGDVDVERRSERRVGLDAVEGDARGALLGATSNCSLPPPFAGGVAAGAALVDVVTIARVRTS